MLTMTAQELMFNRRDRVYHVNTIEVWRAIH